MALSKKLLVEGEREILTIRTHVKTMILSAIALIVVCAAGGFLVAIVPDGDSQQWIRIAIGVIALVLIIWWCLIPFVRWLTSTYHVTNRRLVFQHGFIARAGRDVPLTRINHVTFDRGVIDRIFRCGTLIVYDASEQPGMTLKDVPRIEDVHRTLNELVFAAHEGAHDEDNRPGGSDERDDT